MSSTLEPSERKEHSAETASSKAEVPDTEDYAHGIRLATITASLLLGMFLVALDNVRSILLLHDQYSANQEYF